jgi:AcrR family transcriptional regulator
MSDRQTQILEAAVSVIAQDGVRGLRVDKLAATAGVSTTLIYYHFKDRAGILRAALEHVNARAQSYTDAAWTATVNPRARIEQVLLAELEDRDNIRETSVAWGELRASAVFNTELREPLSTSTQAWNADIEGLIQEAQHAGVVAADADPAAAAERLTALVEGLSERWHSGSISLERARELLAGAVAIELGPEP